ncbi:MAG: FAD-dependent oxidoreductase [Lachnospiraceae bacterium]|nr:FAD-dependent oxidoreductase [Lachnospiraceae bacterium]
MYDMIIVGAGPAGLTAAIYGARAKYRVLVLEKTEIGGQITITSEIVNYPGIAECSGRELTEQMRRQAEDFGAEFLMAEALAMELDKDVKTIYTTQGEYKTLGVILAPGANPRKLGFQGEAKFQGRGVAYCATCDGEFFAGMDVFVIGGGFAAVEESMFLAKYARQITLIVREEDFTCARTISDKLKEYDKIQVIFQTEIVETGGNEMLEYARFRNNETGEEWQYHAKPGETFGIFVFAGYVPNTEWIESSIERDEQGYLITDSNKSTNVPAVYGAGDVCIKNLRQVVTAVSDGAMAATSLEKDVAALHKKLSLPSFVTENSSEEEVREKISKKKEKNTAQDQEDGFFTSELKEQLPQIFEKLKKRVGLRLWLDDSGLSGEMVGFLKEFTSLTTKVFWEEGKGVSQNEFLPGMEIITEEGSSTGIWFHGVPGGHEFNSFLLALLYVAGEVPSLKPDVEMKIQKITEPVNIKILVSLSCTMCPETVRSAQRIASKNTMVTAEMFDLSHFPKLKEQYKVMSVPCAVINDNQVLFGKKSPEEILQALS